MTDLPKTGLDPLPDDDWETRLTKQLVRNIAHYKDELGLTTAELAERYSRVLGEPNALRPTTLNNLLAGKRRSISIAEILTFATALGVPAVALIVPLFSPAPVVSVPIREDMPVDFYAFLVGERRYFLARDDDQDKMEALIAVEALDRIRRLLTAEAEVGNAVAGLAVTARHQESSGVPDATLEHYRSELLAAVKEYRDVRQSLERFGVTLPPPNPLAGWMLHVDDAAVTVAAVREVYERVTDESSSDG